MYSIEAEKAIIAILLNYPELTPEVMSELTERDFYVGKELAYTGKIFQTIKSLVKEKADFTDLQLLSLRSGLDISYLDKFLHFEANQKNLREYIKDVRNATIQRSVEDYKNKIARANSFEQIDGLIREMRQHIYDHDSFEEDHIQSVMDRYLERIEIEKDIPQEELVMSTPFRQVNDVIGGLYSNNFSILAAPAGMGKSLLASQIVVEYLTSIYPDDLFAYTIMETSRERLAERFIANTSGLSLYDVLNRTFFNDAEKKARFDIAVKNLRNKNLLIWGAECMQMSMLRRKLYKYEGRIRLAVIDFLQLMSMDYGRYDNRNQELGAVSKELEQIKSEESFGRLHILALSQVNDNSQSASDKRLTIRSIRDSGEIRANADLIMGIYRDSYFNKQTDQVTNLGDIAEINIVKNRNGRTGDAKLIFNGRDFRFYDLPIGFNEQDYITQDNTDDLFI